MSTKRARSKPHIDMRSVPWVVAIDESIRRANTRGPMSRFRNVAADVLDGWAMREELDDLINRRFLIVVRYGFDDSKKYGPDPARMMNQKMCGSSWSVNPTEKMIRTFWPERLAE